MVTTQAGRQLGLYSDSYWLMYLLVAVACSVCVAGIWLRCRKWRLGHGQLQDRLDNVKGRLVFLLSNIFFQSRVLKKPATGIPHALIIWSFLLFALGTISVMLQENLGLPTFLGSYYLALSFFDGLLCRARPWRDIRPVLETVDSPK